MEFDPNTFQSYRYYSDKLNKYSNKLVNDMWVNIPRAVRWKVDDEGARFGLFGSITTLLQSGAHNGKG